MFTLDFDLVERNLKNLENNLPPNIKYEKYYSKLQNPYPSGFNNQIKTQSDNNNLNK